MNTEEEEEEEEETQQHQKKTHFLHIITISLQCTKSANRNAKTY
jgi:hypothetical protein